MAKAKSDACTQFSVFVVIACLLCLGAFTRIYFNVYKDFLSTEAGTCTTVKSFITEDFYTRCSCGKKCERSYDCLIVEVNLDKSGPPDDDLVTVSPVADDRDQIVHSVTGIRNKTVHVEKQKYVRTNGTLVLYENENALYKKTCSFHIPGCSTSYDQRKKYVDEYDATYGIQGTVFRCSFNPDQPENVVRVTAKKSKFIHYFLWPSLGIVFGFAMFIWSFRSNPHGFCIQMGIAHYCDCLPCACCVVPEVPDKADETTLKKDEKKVSGEEMERRLVGV